MRKFVITVNSQQFEVEVEEVKNDSSVRSVPSQKTNVIPSQPPAASSNVITQLSGANKITAPLPGNIFKVNVKTGDAVKKGQTLLILEAMKMENEITAHMDGTVVNINVNIGDCVSLGQVLIELA